MIATKVEKREDLPDNYTKLGDYIAAAKEDGEKLDKLWIVNCDAGEDLEDLPAALAEIEAVRAFKPDIENKSYHISVSFRPGERERLSLDDLKEIERAFAKALGFAEHQRVAGTHINTDNFHMHVAYNMVHPQTLKMAHPWDDYAALERTARAMERKYGLFVDLGMSDYDQDRARGSQKARAFEAHTWQQSFQNHLLERREDLMKIVGEAKSWRELHAGLAEHGVMARRRGNGLVFAQADGPQAMKASLLDRSASLPALEKRLGAFAPPGEKVAHAAAQARPHRRYKARPLTRHPATGRLWRRYAGARKSTLVRRTLANWKLFLMSEAYRDPLAMVILIAHQEMLHLVFGGDGPSQPATPLPGPAPIPAVARPALDHWRRTGAWARPDNSAWLKERRVHGHGCRVDDEGNLVIPFRDRDGELMGLRLLGQDGRTLDIGNIRGSALTHVIDPNGRLGKVPAIITSDYALGAAIEAATEAPVVVVPDEEAMGPALAALRSRHRNLQPIIATGAPARDHAAPSPEPASVQAAEAERMGAFEEDALSAEDAVTSADDLNPVTLTPPAEDQRFATPMVAIPVDATAMEIRTAFAPALQDRALLAWRETTEWATPGNSAWLKAAGIRGYGVRLTEAGQAAVPLKDLRGRLRDVMFIDHDGRQERLIGDDNGPPLVHLVDPERRFGKDTLVVATDYASAAAIHRETRLPVVMAASPQRWPEVAEALRRRYPDERLVVALDSDHGLDAEAEAERLRAAIVRPSQPEAKPEENRQAPAIKPEDAERRGAFEEDALSAEDALNSANDLNPVSLTPARTFGDLAAVGQGDRIRRDLARAVGDRAFLLWDQGRSPAKNDTHPWLVPGSVKQDLRLDAKGNLLAPLRDTGGRLWGVQVVSPAGDVTARHGRGDRRDLFHVVGDRAKLGRGPVVVAADHASALALHSTTGRPVAVAPDDEALKPVAEALRRRNPRGKIVIAATDMHMARQNTALALAESAAQAVSGTLLRPPLDDDAKKVGLTTFAQIAKARGFQAIATSLQGAGLHVKNGRDFTPE